MTVVAEGDVAGDEDREMLAPDADARVAIRTRLGENLFVEAGAGSGKTSSLVDRVVALVRDGTPIEVIAAITFTEKAAEELRERVRTELERAVADGDEVCARALADLDRAAIGTLHAFAQRLLQEAPIEAGLPPRLEILDDIRSDVAFDARWATFRDRLLDEEALQRPLLLLVAAGGKLPQIRELARLVNASWDRVEALLARDDGPVVREVPALDRTAVLTAARALCKHRADCRDPSDHLCAALDEWAEWMNRLEAADELHAVTLLGAVPGKGRGGRKDNWTKSTVDAIKAEIDAVQQLARAARDRVVEVTLDRIVGEVMRFTIEAASARRSEGRLEFHDLLVLGRALLRDPVHGAAVRTRLHARYRHLLLDEFQDTDPIQLEIAVLLAAAPGGSARPTGVAVGDGDELEWADIPLTPGAVFVVGDPKQSIYRFRRADIGLFLAAQERLVSADARITLSANFRSAPEVVRFVNDLFARLIQPVPTMQPAYHPLDAVRPPLPPGAGPAVTLLGVDEHTDKPKADELRRAEAADVARTILTARAEGWLVRRRESQGESWEPLRLADICVLIPARTSLGALEDALTDAAIPYRTETASLVYSTREIRDLMMVLRAIDDPTDEAALVAALRTPWLGCGDDELLEYRRGHGGWWSFRASLPDSLPADHPVAAALTFLRALHDDRQWATASELLDRVVRQRRVLELGFAMPRPRDLWRRVRFVLDQARAFEDAAGGDLRDFLRWVELQSAEGARVVEAVLPETDDDAVRIMTVHAAKGLEFPMVILSGMSTEPRGASGVQLLWHDGVASVKLNKQVASRVFDEQLPIDEQMDHHERLRLLYVACTRAQDHLVVSVHRKPRDAADDARRTNAELVWRAGHDLASWAAVTWVSDNASAGASAVSQPSSNASAGASAGQSAVSQPSSNASAGASAPHAALASFADWEAEHRRLTDPARAERVVSASALARAAAELAGQLTRVVEDDDGRVEIVVDDPALQKEPRDLELPPWMKGRYGTAVGRAVHAVLQTIDLDTGAGIDAAVAAQAAAEGVFGFEARIVALARAALASDTVRAAVRGRHWRETYVAIPGRDGRVLEGYVDLLYERADGLVVVDYKTDAVGSYAEIDQKVAHYRLQGAAYAHAVARATGQPVVECVFLFLTEHGAIARVLPELAAAVAEVESAV